MRLRLPRAEPRLLRQARQRAREAIRAPVKVLPRARGVRAEAHPAMAVRVATTRAREALAAVALAAVALAAVALAAAALAAVALAAVAVPLVWRAHRPQPIR